MTATIESEFISLVSNLVKKRLNSFKFLAADSLLERLFLAIAPLYCIEFLVKFVSSLGRMILPFLLLSRLEFLCTNISLNSEKLKPLLHLKTNSISRTLYIASKLFHCVSVKTALVSHGNPFTIRPALTCSFSRLLKCLVARSQNYKTVRHRWQ